METLNAIRKRKSVRGYLPDPVPEDLLNTVLAAGCAAPVGMGRYGDLQITVITREDLRKTISEAVGKVFRSDGDMLYGAPVIVLLSAKEDVVPGINHTNAGCILENMALAATDAGLGCCVLGGPPAVVNPSPELKQALGIPEGYVATGSIAIGYAAVPDDSEKDLKITVPVNRV